MAAKSTWRQRLAAGLDAHHRVIISAAIGIVAFAVLPSRMGWWARGLSGWNAYAMTTLLLAWLTIIHANPADVASNAKLEDSSRAVIFFSLLLASVVSLVAVGVLLGTAKDLHGALLTAHVLFAIVTVLCSWTLVHTTYALHYGHMFYSADEKGERGGGLEFPKEDNPDYLDFAYHSFVIGMTCQVSDIDITGRSMRRAALLHGIISFGFNTAIVAMGVNLTSGLFSR